MDMRKGILSTANALGVNPLDLATAISYETAGTFDPMKTGPTTQWGQHRGLIQFGEPQAKKYGVSWDDPVGSQLGPQGAVANYLRDTGVKPGMGLLDIYSAINAGGVGRYNRSDANNGGAPGTVRDKVEKQMAGHRKKAQALLGGAGDDTLAGGLSITPSSPPDHLQGAQMQQPEQQQRQHMFLKNMDPATRDRLIMAMQGMTMNPNQGLMGMAQQNMQDRATAGREAKAEAKGAEQRNRTAEWLMTQPGGQEYAQAIASGALPAAAALQMWQKASAGQAPVKGVAINNQLINPQTGEQMGDYRDNNSEMTTTVQSLDQRAQMAGLQRGTPEYQQFMINGGASKGISLTVGKDGQIQFTQGNVGKPQDVTNPSSVPAMISSIDGILNDPALDFATGFLEWTQNIPGTAAKRFGARVKQLDGQAFLQAFESLKGGGHITEIEGQKATQAIGRLDASQSPEDYRNALTELKGLLQLGMERERTGGTIQSDAPSVNNIDINGTSYTIQRVD